jgi:hypothetical protein
VVLPAFCAMLERDRRRRGFTAGQLAWRLGIKVRDRKLVAGERRPDPDTWDLICKLYGWRRRYVG